MNGAAGATRGGGIDRVVLVCLLCRCPLRLRVSEQPRVRNQSLSIDEICVTGAVDIVLDNPPSGVQQEGTTTTHPRGCQEHARGYARVTAALTESVSSAESTTVMCEQGVAIARSRNATDRDRSRTVDRREGATTQGVEAQYRYWSSRCHPNHTASTSAASSASMSRNVKRLGGRDSAGPLDVEQWPQRPHPCADVQGER